MSYKPIVSFFGTSKLCTFTAPRHCYFLLFKFELSTFRVVTEHNKWNINKAGNLTLVNHSRSGLCFYIPQDLIITPWSVE